MECAGTPFLKFFLRTTQAGTAFTNLYFPGVGVTNTTPLRPNFGSLFAFRKVFQKKNSAECTELQLSVYNGS
jgi:hypothetical protein